MKYEKIYRVTGFNCGYDPLDVLQHQYIYYIDAESRLKAPNYKVGHGLLNEGRYRRASMAPFIESSLGRVMAVGSSLR